MVDIERLKEEIKRDEGVVYEVYKCSLDHRTFGVGHKILKSDPEWHYKVGDKVSEDRVDEAFFNDLYSTVQDTQRLFPEFDELPGEIQLVLCNMIFNMGYSRLYGFRRMRAAVDRRDWKAMAVEMQDSVWYRQVPNRAKRLIKRVEALA